MEVQNFMNLIYFTALRYILLTHATFYTKNIFNGRMCSPRGIVPRTGVRLDHPTGSAFPGRPKYGGKCARIYLYEKLNVLHQNISYSDSRNDFSEIACSEF